MKLENKRAAQARRAKERQQQARLKILKQFIWLPIAIIVVVLVVLALSASAGKSSSTGEPAESTSNELASGEIDSSADMSEIVENGDTVNIDYVGYVDGVEFNGGNTQGAGTNLTIGSGTYIDGFEEQLIGHKSGESFDIIVTFPDGYGSTTTVNGDTVSLDNQDAVFAITINSISKH